MNTSSSFLCNQNLVFWLGLKGREEVIRQTPMGCTTLKTLNDYHSSLIQKKKKHPIKERKQMQNPCFFHMAMKKGREEAEWTRVPPNLFFQILQRSQSLI